MSKLLLFGILIPAIAYSGEIIDASKDSTRASYPRVEVQRQSGELFAVWQDDAGLFFRRFSAAGEALTPDVRFSDNGEKPVIGVGSDNVARIAWLQSSGVNLVFLNNAGQIVFGPILVDSHRYEPAIAVGGDNHTSIVFEHVLFMLYRTRFVRYDETGQELVRLFFDNGDIIGDQLKQPDVLSDIEGSSGIIFYDRFGFDGIKLTMTVVKADNAMPGRQILLNSLEGSRPTIAFDFNSADAVFTFFQGADGGRQQIYSQLLTGAPRVLCSSPASSQHPRAAVFGKYCYNVYQISDGAHWQIALSKMDKFGHRLGCWQLTNNDFDSQNPDIAFINNRLSIIWQRQDAGNSVISLQTIFEEQLPPSELAEFKRGDANRDNRLDLSDAVAIIRFLFGNGRLICLDAADVDDSGSHNLADAIYLLQYLFATGPPPLPPFNDVGVDPTADNLDCRS